MSSKYSYTRAHHFKSKLDETNETNELNEEKRHKILTQYELFNNEYKNISKEYNLKNCIDFQYIKYTLINLNRNNPEFTKTPIEIEANIFQDDIIHQCLMEKIPCPKKEITEFLFNKVCINLGWFVKVI
jgi:hypothetical protein